MRAYKFKKAYTSSTIIENGFIVVNDGKIVDINKSLNYACEEIIDYSHYNIAPSFIDIQIYGGGGSLFNTKPKFETIKKTFDEISKKGTAYFQITLSTVDLDTMLSAIDACKEYKKTGGQGLIGLHLEGPYFNPLKRGAHVERFVRKPTIEELKILFDKGSDVITYLTFAPEVMDDECLTFLQTTNAKLSLGHSNSTYEEAMITIGKGVNLVTHLFNAMSQFMSRAPGLVGACYASNVNASVVADGVHVDFNAIAISKKIMQERLFYITDAVTEDTDGDYAFWKKDNHYVTKDGVLAGSALTMMQAVKNGVMHCKFSIEESLRMASYYPAKVMGMDSFCGKLNIGYEAKFIVFDDELNLITHLY